MIKPESEYGLCKDCSKADIPHMMCDGYLRWRARRHLRRALDEWGQFKKLAVGDKV